MLIMVMFDETFNNSFKEKLESVQCNICLALKGAIRGTSREKIIPRAEFVVPLKSTLVQKTLLFL